MGIKWCVANAHGDQLSDPILLGIKLAKLGMIAVSEAYRIKFAAAAAHGN